VRSQALPRSEGRAIGASSGQPRGPSTVTPRYVFIAVQLKLIVGRGLSRTPYSKTSVCDTGKK